MRGSAIVRIRSSAPWEPMVGYSRAVRAGAMVAVSGTTSIADGRLVGAGQMYVQARQALENIATALGRTGLSTRDVVRTRMFVTDISRWQDVARAHREFFADNPPAATMVEVRRLISPDLLIEIEADAYDSGTVAAAPKARPLRKSRSAASAKKPARKRKRSR